MARKAFNDMLAENAFVEFWGRLGKLGGEGVDGGVKAEELDGDDGEGFGGKVDMKALAKNVDLNDIVKVLRVGISIMCLRLLSNNGSSRTINGTLSLTMCPSSGRGGYE